MDTYHKVLTKIYEMTGGKELVDVDLTDLLKKEGYFPSLEEISNHLKTEGWVTETRANVVRITHWGAAEAKKAGTSGSDAAKAIEREGRRLLAESREFSAVVEAFLGDPSSEHISSVRKKFAEMEKIVAGLASG